MEQLKSILQRTPYALIAVFFLCYIVWDWHWFTTSEDSDLIKKQNEIVNIGEDISKAQTKLKEQLEFQRTFEQKQVELRELARRLNEMKATLTDNVDIPRFMKMVISEAQRVGMVVIGLKPVGQIKRDFYMEQSFALTFTGAYVQFLVFLNHLALVDQIARVDDFTLSKKGADTAPYVELTGNVEVKAFSYLGSKADVVAKNLRDSAPPTKVTTPSAPSAGGAHP